MTPLLQIGDEIVPDHTPELILGRSSRHVGSLLVCALTFCTFTRKAQAGQEGTAKTDQMSVCYGRPTGSVLVLVEPALPKKGGCPKRGEVA